MIYNKKYPILNNTDSIEVQWERGYKNVTLFHCEREMYRVSNPIELKKGVTFIDPIFNEVQLVFSAKPITIDIIVNGFHSPINSTHPSKQIFSSSRVFYLVAVLSLLGTIIELNQYPPFDFVGFTILMVNLMILTCYILAIVSSYQNKSWGYWFGFGAYSVVFLLSIFTALLDLTFLSVITLGVKSLIFAVILSYYKTAVSLKKHEASQSLQNDALLDG